LTDTDGGWDRAVYTISVAAELVGTSAQNLRAYERAGLVSPARTDGGTRRYSEKDIERLRRVADLLATGVNLAGVELVLDLQDDNRQLREAGRDDGHLPSTVTT
jgi:MerR family transcriptional regulator/heat shock protein HspR